MSRQSKIINVSHDSVYSLQDTVKHYESFGWELLNINGNTVSMTRETQNPVYSQLLKYESEYEEIIEKISTLETRQNVDISALTAFILLLIFVVPGVLYLVFKNMKRNEINEYNEKIVTERQELKIKAEKICQDSRALFFARQ